MTGYGRLRDRAAIVTGAGRGIGRGIALALADDGARVLVTDVDLAAAEAVAAACTARRGGPADGIPAAAAARVDVTQPADVRAMLAAAVAHWGAVDVLVCNAGILSQRPFFDLAVEEWDRVFAVNARGVFLCIQTVGRHMAQRRSGAIVTVASTGAKAGRAWMPHYNASKAAALNLTWSAAQALAPHGVRCNAVCPGLIESDMNQQIIRSMSEMFGTDEGTMAQRRLEQVPLGRAGTPDDVAKLVVFLASDDAAYITGQGYNVCGGMRME